MDARAMIASNFWNAQLHRAVRAAGDAREPFVYRHRATGTFADRAFVLASIGSPSRKNGAPLAAREWEPVLIDAPALPG